MTIKEVEALSGMTRANIRYYENEGLLRPSRQANGYRNYTEEDLDALKKIGLLRRLGVPVGDIRSLQSGETQLIAILDRRIADIGRQRAGLEETDAICRAIRAENPTYRDLDPDIYLIRVACASKKQPQAFSLSDDVPAVSLPHPWRRWLARTLDLSIYSVLWCAVLGFVFRTPPLARSTGELLLDAIAVLLLNLFLEPLFLSFAGATPGKAVLGLRYTVNGRRPSYFDALCRTGQVLCGGMGLCIPIYSWIRQYKCYKTVQSGGLLPWEEEGQYTLCSRHWARLPVLAICFALCFALSLGVDRLSQLPPHRGNLTIADFADNMNDRMRYLGLNPSQQLNDQGQWEDRPYDGMIYTLASDDAFPAFSYDVQNGVLTGLHFSVRSEKELVTQSYLTAGAVAALSFICAQPEYAIFSSDIGRIVSALAQSPFESTIFHCAGVTLTYTVDVQGYIIGQSLFADPESDAHSFFARFSLQLD